MAVKKRKRGRPAVAGRVHTFKLDAQHEAALLRWQLKSKTTTRTAALRNLLTTISEAYGWDAEVTNG